MTRAFTPGIPVAHAHSGAEESLALYFQCVVSVLSVYCQCIVSVLSVELSVYCH